MALFLTANEMITEMSSEKSLYNSFLLLLRAGLGLVDPPEMTLTESEWRKVMREAEKQTVTGVTFGALSKMSESGLPPVGVQALWLSLAHREARKYAGMSRTLTRLVSQFEDYGLHPVLQKGHAAARFYSVPELRTSGDIDLWFPDDERSDANKIVRELGMNVEGTPDDGSRYICDGFDVEHHSMLVEIHNPFHTSRMDGIYREYHPVKVMLNNDISAFVPAPLVELLMMNAHILKHCLGFGIGLRQFCDYTLAWRCFTDPDSKVGVAVNQDEYVDLCRKLGILKWTSVLHQFINRYLPASQGNAVADIPGTSCSDSSCSDTVSRIFNLVAEGGNFGRYSSQRRTKCAGNLWRRKLRTMTAFINNRSFVCRTAPSEAFWTFSRLLVGQVH